MKVNMDCRHFRGDRPCSPHKRHGRRCEQCEEYEPLTKKVLIVKLAADGDVLRTTCLLPALKKELPGCHITWVTESSAEPLLANNPLIDRVLSPPERFLPVLLAGAFDIVINTDADIRCCSLATLSPGKEKRGFDLDEQGTIRVLSDPAMEWFQLGLWDDLKRANRRSYPEIIYKIAGLEGPVSQPMLVLTDDETEDAVEHLNRCGWHKNSDRQVIGLNTGAGQRWKRKALPVETIEHVIANILGSSPGVDIFLLGGPEEKERNAFLAGKYGSKVIDTGTKNSLRRFASIVSHTDVLLTADTLAMHIGMALRKFVVVHFGPTSPWEIDLWKNGEKLTPVMDCICCYLPDCDMSPACNERITPEQIVKSLQKGLAHSAQGPL